MNFVLSILFSVFVFLGSQSVFAHNGFEIGLGAGTSHPFAGDNFKSLTSSGDANTYWIGYYLTENVSVNLNLDSYDFDRTNISGQMISAGATYKFWHDQWVHPLAQISLGSVSTKNFSSDKLTGSGAKLVAGLEADFKWVTVGAVTQWIYNDKVIGSTTGSSQVDNAQAILPALTVSFHLPFDHKSESVKTAPVQEPVAKVVERKDADADGISDDVDKCPNTAAGVKVNAIGCSETEKASVKLNLEFAGGKSEIAEKYNAEILNLAEFMKKFPETKVEIAGHTDSRGNAIRNTKLSQARAEAVKAALVKSGINADRVIAKGYGSSQPVANNETLEGRAQNRRVVAEISIETEVKK